MNELIVLQAQTSSFRSRSHVNQIEREIKSNNWYREVDPNELSLEELEELKFGLWSKRSGLWLIPIWLVPYLVEVFHGSSIDKLEERELKKEKLDLDTRFGYIAYGIVKKETE